MVEHIGRRAAGRIIRPPVRQTKPMGKAFHHLAPVFIPLQHHQLFTVKRCKAFKGDTLRLVRAADHHGIGPGITGAEYPRIALLRF